MRALSDWDLLLRIGSRWKITHIPRYIVRAYALTQGSLGRRFSAKPHHALSRWFSRTNVPLRGRLGPSVNVPSARAAAPGVVLNGQTKIHFNPMDERGAL